MKVSHCLITEKNPNKQGSTNQCPLKAPVSVGCPISDLSHLRLVCGTLFCDYIFKNFQYQLVIRTEYYGSKGEYF